MAFGEESDRTQEPSEVTPPVPQPQKAATKTLLHVGCGENHKDRTTPGFQGDEWSEIRLDIDPAAQPDIVASMTDLTPIADQSVDAIYSSHNIEHLYPHEIPVAFKEFVRVLKPDGFLITACPDLEVIASMIVQGRLMAPAYNSLSGPIRPYDMLYGSERHLARGALHMAHRSGFTRDSLGSQLRAAGFRSFVGRKVYPDLWMIATVASCSPERRLELASAHLPAHGPSLRIGVRT